MAQEQTMLKMVMDRWQALNKNFNADLNGLSDEQLQREISPGRNRGIYLLGHLTAVHDDMMVLLGFGDKLFPELSEPFLKSPDKAVLNIPSAAELRAVWTKVSEVLASNFEKMSTADWFQRHTAVSADDFVGEPHRNKLNILLTRASHLAYHHGQFILIK